MLSVIPIHSVQRGGPEGLPHHSKSPVSPQFLLSSQPPSILLLLWITFNFHWTVSFNFNFHRRKTSPGPALSLFLFENCSPNFLWKNYLDPRDMYNLILPPLPPLFLHFRRFLEISCDSWIIFINFSFWRDPWKFLRFSGIFKNSWWRVKFLILFFLKKPLWPQSYIHFWYCEVLSAKKCVKLCKICPVQYVSIIDMMEWHNWCTQLS